MATKGILFALVGRAPDIVLTEVAIHDDTLKLGGGYTPAAVGRKILKLTKEEAKDKMSYSYGQHTFHHIVSNGLVYLCMSDLTFPRQGCFAFLKGTVVAFEEAFGRVGLTAGSLEMSAEFDPRLAARMTGCNQGVAEHSVKTDTETSRSPPASPARNDSSPLHTRTPPSSRPTSPSRSAPPLGPATARSANPSRCGSPLATKVRSANPSRCSSPGAATARSAREYYVGSSQTESNLDISASVRKVRNKRTDSVSSVSSSIHSFSENPVTVFDDPSEMSSSKNRGCIRSAPASRRASQSPEAIAAALGEDCPQATPMHGQRSGTPSGRMCQCAIS